MKKEDYLGNVEKQAKGISQMNMRMNKPKDNSIVIAYWWILNYSSSEAVDMELVTSKDTMKRIAKEAVRYNNRLKLSQHEAHKIHQRLTNIKEAFDTISSTSHEMLSYLCIDFLMNAYEDAVARNRFFAY